MTRLQLMPARHRPGLLCIVSLLAALAGVWSPAAAADKRVALVVGNSAYRSTAPLDNPANDAKLIADTLRKLGFTLVGGDAQLDLDKPALDHAVQAFAQQLIGADAGLFYYAGHGVQVRGNNYLVPVDANPTREADVDFQMLDTNLVLRQMQAAGTRLNVVILDACRNDPFTATRGLAMALGRRVRDISGDGLAEMRVPAGTLVSFATQPQSVARDGADGHSPYSRALADAMQQQPGLGLFDVFNRVSIDVNRDTNGAQDPYVAHSAIQGNFYFTPPDHPNASQSASLSPQPATAAVGDPARFNGMWNVSVACNFEERTIRLVGRVANGSFHAERGQDGQPGWDVYDGTIGPDGSIRLEQNGLSGRDTKSDPFHRPPGTKFHNLVIGVLNDTSGTASRTDQNCNYEFTKQSRSEQTAAKPVAPPAVPAARPIPAIAPPPEVKPLAPLPPQDQTRVGSLTTPPATSDVGRFDGIWITKVVCEQEGDVPGSSVNFFGRVQNSVFQGQTGAEGRPGWTTYNGTIEPDGSIALIASGLTGNPKTAINHPPAGTKWSAQYVGRMDGSRGSALRVTLRTCHMDLTKQ